MADRDRLPARRIPCFYWAWGFALVGGLLAGAGDGLARGSPDSLFVQPGIVDTAAVALDIARDLRILGRDEEARSLLQYILDRFPGSPSAREAQILLTELRVKRMVGRGETQFITWNTAFAAWLGLAVPIAAGSEDESAYGAALLVSAPIGFLAARAYTRSHPVSQGQAGAYLWSTVWGTWQAIGWREALDLWETESCYDYGFGEECYSSETENAWTKAALIGGAVGVAGGMALVGQDIRAGDAALVSHASVWATFYGFSIAGMADAENDALLTWGLIAGNVGLLAAIPAARTWHPPRQRVALMSAAGLAGGLAGIGVDLLVQPEGTAGAIAIPAAGVTVGLITGALLTGKTEWDDEASGPSPSGALLGLGPDAGFSLPFPQPGTVTTLDRSSRRRRLPSVEVRILQAGF